MRPVPVGAILVSRVRLWTPPRGPGGSGPQTVPGHPTHLARRNELAAAERTRRRGGTNREHQGVGSHLEGGLQTPRTALRIACPTRKTDRSRLGRGDLAPDLLLGLLVALLERLLALLL